jgi:hypothetical protein
MCPPELDLTVVCVFGPAGECGYNQLLYPSEAFVRPFIVWLVEHLPRHEEEGGEEEVRHSRAMIQLSGTGILTTIHILKLDWNLSGLSIGKNTCCAAGSAGAAQSPDRGSAGAVVCTAVPAPPSTGRASRGVCV